LLGVFVAAVIGLRAGFSWKEVETGMLNGITNSLQAIVILAIIGILIGVWILSGVVPTLLYYGLKILHPKIFLPATLIICSITSLATGSSWGTSGTIGIALIGIGDGLGFPCRSWPVRSFPAPISATKCPRCPTPPTWRRPWWAPTCTRISST
jgi:NhaC family Na+:H+ antiporter